MTSPLHFPGMTYVQGPYVVNYTDLPNDGNTKTLWTPAIGDVIIGIWADSRTYIGGMGDNGFMGPGGLYIGTAAIEKFFMSGSPMNFTDFYIGNTSLFTPVVVSAISPVTLKYVANGNGSLTAGYGEFYTLIAKGTIT